MRMDRDYQPIADDAHDLADTARRRVRASHLSSKRNQASDCLDRSSESRMLVEQPVDHRWPLLDVRDAVERRSDIYPCRPSTGHLIPRGAFAKRQLELFFFRMKCLK